MTGGAPALQGRFFLAVLGVGGYRVATGSLPAADMIAFMLYVRYLGSPVLVITAAVAQLPKALAVATRVMEVDGMETETPTAVSVAGQVPSSAVALAAQPVRSGPPSVEFDQVGFSYRTDAPIPSQVSFRISPGTKTAIVGPAGAGKSTVLSLLEYLYEPTSGHILMDHEDITNIPLTRHLRRRNGLAAVGGRAPACRGRAPGATSPRVAAVGRGNLAAGFGQRTSPGRSPGYSGWRIHNHSDRAPPVHGGGGPDHRAGRRNGAPCRHT